MFEAIGEGYIKQGDIKRIRNVINALKKYRNMYYKEYRHHIDYKEYHARAENRASALELNKLCRDDYKSIVITIYKYLTGEKERIDKALHEYGNGERNEYTGVLLGKSEIVINIKSSIDKLLYYFRLTNNFNNDLKKGE